MIRQREMEEQMRRQREENYSRMGYMDPVSDIVAGLGCITTFRNCVNVFSRSLCFASFGLATALCLCRGSAVVGCTCALCPEKSGFWWLIIQGKRCFFYAEGARHENGWCCHNEHGR